MNHRVLAVRGGRWWLSGGAGYIITSEVIMLSGVWFAEVGILEMLGGVLVSFVNHRVWAVRGGQLVRKIVRGGIWESRLRRCA